MRRTTRNTVAPRFTAGLGKRSARNTTSGCGVRVGPENHHPLRSDVGSEGQHAAHQGRQGLKCSTAPDGAARATRPTTCRPTSERRQGVLRFRSSKEGVRRSGCRRRHLRRARQDEHHVSRETETGGWQPCGSGRRRASTNVRRWISGVRENRKAP